MDNSPPSGTGTSSSSSGFLNAQNADEAPPEAAAAAAAAAGGGGGAAPPAQVARRGRPLNRQGHRHDQRRPQMAQHQRGAAAAKVATPGASRRGKAKPDRYRPGVKALREIRSYQEG